MARFAQDSKSLIPPLHRVECSPPVAKVRTLFGPSVTQRGLDMRFEGTLT
jgi:hypothetical protein